MAGWQVAGNIRGPEGPEGPRGPEGPQGTEGPRGLPGQDGSQGPQGERGPKGDPGQDGRGIEIAGSVPTYADLPSDLGAGDAGKGYLVEASGLLYVWSGTAFPTQGGGVAFRGPVGPEGPQGIEGPRGPQGEIGPEGPRGLKGDTGAKGDTGQRGSKWFTGAGVPSGVTGAVAGDMYLDTTTGAVYEFQ